MAKGSGTYVYCVVSNPTRPRLSRKAAGLTGLGAVRLVDVDRSLFLVVADAPLSRYNADAINRRLADVDWVSRAALAHEAVVESFGGAAAALPMKLFTIFTSDDRAVEHVRGQRRRIAATARRVAHHDEWGVRVIFDAAHASAAPRESHAATPARSNGRSSGLAYLTRKKSQRDAGIERAAQARDAVAALYDRLSARATLARRKSADEMPLQGGPLLLDAAFLVPRSRAASFRSFAARQGRALARHGYGLTLTGPWPPYSFVE